MIKNNLTAHMIVRNEEQWVWYAVFSVIDYVDRILIYDTDSTDKTVEIIQKIKSPKIEFYKKGDVAVQRLVDLRNEQINSTNTSWFMLLDGDEVWPERTIREAVLSVKKADSKLKGIVVKSRVCLGDLFHYQTEKAGKYRLLGKTGHYNLRFYKKLPLFHWHGTYPNEAYVNKSGVSLQNQEADLIMLKNEYWHMTHLTRSKIDTHNKRKIEFGISNENTKLPEVFFKPRPDIVASPWLTFNCLEKSVARVMTPVLNLKRNLI
jgi:glycosyltransferase involved in cell wall biosynthesis